MLTSDELRDSLAFLLRYMRTTGFGAGCCSSLSAEAKSNSKLSAKSLSVSCRDTLRAQARSDDEDKAETFSDVPL